MTQEIIQNTDSPAAITAPQLTGILEALQQRARTCATAAQDSSEQALTGESNDREKNTHEANIWLIKSQVWLEAEMVVREINISPHPAVILN
jgi:hypothetical protein